MLETSKHMEQQQQQQKKAKRRKKKKTPPSTTVPSYIHSLVHSFIPTFICGLVWSISSGIVHHSFIHSSVINGAVLFVSYSSFIHLWSCVIAFIHFHPCTVDVVWLLTWLSCLWNNIYVYICICQRVDFHLLYFNVDFGDFFFF